MKALSVPVEAAVRGERRPGRRANKPLTLIRGGNRWGNERGGRDRARSLGANAAERAWRDNRGRNVHGALLVPASTRASATVSALRERSLAKAEHKTGDEYQGP